MNRLEAALLEVVGFLEARRTRYMVVGGFASLLIRLTMPAETHACESA